MTTSKNKSDLSPTEQDLKAARINMIVSKTFHKEIKQRALDEDITITELICKAVKEYLKK